MSKSYVPTKRDHVLTAALVLYVAGTSYWLAKMYSDATEGRKRLEAFVSENKIGEDCKLPDGSRISYDFVWPAGFYKAHRSMVVNVAGVTATVDEKTLGIKMMTAYLEGTDEVTRQQFSTRVPLHPSCSTYLQTQTADAPLAGVN